MGGVPGGSRLCSVAGIALWCLYLAGVIALFVVTFINYVVEGFFRTLSLMLLTWAFLSFDLLCIAGLYAYLRSLVLFAESIWQILVVLLGIRLSFSAPLFLLQLHPWEGTTEQYVALFALLSSLYCIPMIWALWAYAFRSSTLWRAGRWSAPQ